MKQHLFLSLIGLIILSSCSKDNIHPAEQEILKPFVKAKINEQPFCLYRDSVHMYENAAFSFGTAILTYTESGEVLDSSLTIRASVGEKHVSIQFPYQQAVNQQSIKLYRNTPDITYHWASVGLECVTLINGVQQGRSYSTYCFYKENSLSEPVGEIKITSFNANSKSLKGTFQFTAFGMKHENSRVVETDEKLIVDNGEFYVEWEDDLFKPVTEL